VAQVPTECVIGVDLGGTNLKAGAIAPDLSVLFRAHRVIAGLSLPELLESITDAINEVRASVDVDLDAVGLGVPALIDDARALAVSSTHLPIAGLPVAAVMSERLALPVFVDNDANLALLAEHRHGAARGEPVALMLTLGTGVGGAIMLGGELYRGARGAAGALGHLIVQPDGPACGRGCRGRGCLEAFVSGGALARDARAVALREREGALARALAAGREVDGPLVSELARGGDGAALALLRTLGEWLGIGLTSLANIFDPDVIVVGGGVGGAGELILEPARAVLAERAPAFLLDHVAIRAARFGADAGMLGAAVLARESAARRVLA